MRVSVKVSAPVIEMPKSSIEEIRKARDDTIAQLRHQGVTLKQIGHELGVSKQRVFQIIEKRLPELVSYDPCSKVAITLGISNRRLYNWKQYWYPGKRWSDSIAEEALCHFQCVCPICGRFFICSSYHKKYDSQECQRTARKNCWEKKNASYRLSHSKSELLERAKSREGKRNK